MIRIIASILIVLLPQALYALGLDELELESGLNQPFEAHIELLSSTAEEIDSLKVQLADTEAFARAGIERSFLLSQLRFEIIQAEDSNDFIRVFSEEPISEPFLNFLLEINWNRGRLLREYTALLDPPTYSPNLHFDENATTTPKTSSVPVTRTPTPKVPSNSINRVVDPDHVVVHNPGPVSSSSISGGFSNGDYTSSKGDTLWGIAAETRSGGVSMQQMMMALYRSNPDAFINNNINGLKIGQIFTIPELSEVQSLSKTAAIAAVAEQNSLWDELRGVIAKQAQERPESAGVSSSEFDGTNDVDTAVDPDSGVGAVVEPELRLVAADGTEAASGEGSSENTDGTDALSAELLSAEESLISLESENRELEDRLVEAESIITDLNNIIILKENELALLKQQVTGEIADLEIENLDTEVIEEVADVFETNKTTKHEVVYAEDFNETALGDDEAWLEQDIIAQELIVKDPVEHEVVYAEDFDEGSLVDEEIGLEQNIIADEPIEHDVVYGEDFNEERIGNEEEGIEEEVDSSLQQGSIAQQDVIDAQSTSVNTMGFFEKYLAPIKALILANLISIGGGIGAILLLLLGYVGFDRWRAGRAEVVEFDEADVMDFSDLKQESDTDQMMDVNEASDLSEDNTGENLIMDDTVQDKSAIVGLDGGLEVSEEDDPLAEVNVFLAYEHFEQAADFVKAALEEQPERLDFHTKLLEVYYAANDKVAYEDAAEVLHEKVDGSGEHWDMALAMWSEISPHRALFEKSVGDTQELPTRVSNSSGGIVDLTAVDTEAGVSTTGGGLDFDIGEDTSKSTLDTTTVGLGASIAADAGEVLDIAADTDILDITASDSNEELLEDTADNVGRFENTDELKVNNDNDGLLNLTVTGDGLTDSSDDILDISAGSSDMDMLDITTSNEDDLLDVTSATNFDSEEGDDLLDLTAASVFEADDSDMLEVDLAVADDLDDGSILDVTAGADLEDGSVFDISVGDINALDTSDFGVDMENLDLDISAGSSVEGDSELDISVVGTSVEVTNENSIDFDIDSPEDLDMDVTGAGDASTESALDMSENSMIERVMQDNVSEPEIESDESVVDFDVHANDEEHPASIDLDLTSSPDEEEVLDISTMERPVAKKKFTLSVSAGDMKTDAAQTDKLDESDFQLDLDESADLGGMELDLTGGMSLDEENSDSIALDDDDFKVEMNVPPNAEEDDFDMDGTVELPKIDFDIDDGEEDADTVFVPRSSDSNEQNIEDEVSTKLDLARAYVELGDNDSAKAILNEITTEGNAEQKRQAQELLSQV